MREDIIIKGIKLVETCGACPEQYDAYNGEGKIVGYLRLRYGWFQVRYPNSRGNIIFEAHPKGDGLFESDERLGYLMDAVKAIKKAIKKDKFK